MAEAETPLTDGWVTAGVVRVGNTVRRPPTANSDVVRRLLEHLASRCFDGAPVWLGTDTHGGDVFSFIEGGVLAELAHHGDATRRRPAGCLACALPQRNILLTVLWQYLVRVRVAHD
jgi:hypothetical protein